MKTASLIITVLFLVSVAASQTLIARTEMSTDFVVNGTMLPAGHYQVTSDGHFLQIQNTKSGQTVKVGFRTVKQSCADTRLILATDKDRQVLHRICRAGDNYAFDLAHGNDVYNPVLPE